MTARPFIRGMMPIGVRAAVLLAALSVAACGADSATAPTTTTSPTTATWSSLLTPGGAVSRSITTTQAGTITLTLIGADVPVTLGIGVPRVANGGCRVSVSQYVDSPNTSISAAVETGNYCVEVFDQANLVVKQAAFTAQVTYP